MIVVFTLTHCRVAKRGALMVVSLSLSPYPDPHPSPTPTAGQGLSVYTESSKGFTGSKPRVPPSLLCRGQTEGVNTFLPTPQTHFQSICMYHPESNLISREPPELCNSDLSRSLLNEPHSAIVDVTGNVRASSSRRQTLPPQHVPLPHPYSPSLLSLPHPTSLPPRGWL